MATTGKQLEALIRIAQTVRDPAASPRTIELAIQAAKKESCTHEQIEAARWAGGKWPTT